MTPIEELGIAISDANIDWTPAMRDAWNRAKNRDEAHEKITEAAETIFVALKHEIEPQMILAEHSPVMDALRDALLSINAAATPPKAFKGPQ